MDIFAAYPGVIQFPVTTVAEKCSAAITAKTLSGTEAVSQKGLGHILHVDESRKTARAY